MTRSNRKTKDAPAVETAPQDKEVLWGGFIDIRMTSEDKETYKSWLTENQTEYWSLFEDCLGKGMKYSLSWDMENDCFISTFTAILEFSTNYRYVLTSRASQWETSLSLLLFKHYFMLKENWATFKPSTGRGAEV